MSPRVMKKPDELEIIKIFQGKFGLGSRFVPEDLESIPLLGQKVFVKADMLVQSTDAPNGMTLAEMARKSIVSCVSDFASKGIRPRYALISLALPRGISRKSVFGLASGFASASKEFGVKIIGGDVNEGKEIIIDVSMFGTGSRISRRGGAKVGDVVITTGPFGYASSGLKIILEGIKAEKGFAKRCKGRVFLPKPRLEFGLQAARYFTSSMDSSDGLSTTLNDMSSISSRRFVIDRIPTGKDVVGFARKNKIDPTYLVFCGGEEYEIVATVPQKNIGVVRRIARRLGVDLFEIGRVASGKGVFLETDTSHRTLERCGWVHFRS